VFSGDLGRIITGVIIVDINGSQRQRCLANRSGKKSDPHL
jgi:hypothetical protein